MQERQEERVARNRKGAFLPFKALGKYPHGTDIPE